MVTITEAKARLDLIIAKGRVDLYKPIQIAEVLHYSRIEGGIDIRDVETYRNPSLHWRNKVTQRFMGKGSTSSAQYQHNVWHENAMPPNILAVLDKENKKTQGAIERYIYLRYAERQETVANILALIQAATPENFRLESLLNLFVTQKGIRRSIDKAYEIVAHSLFETIVVALKATVKVSVPETSKVLLKEFADLARVLLGLEEDKLGWEQPAHIYRVGVTNAADRGLDMWANFGPAIQVKHLTLNEKRANAIVDQIESDHVVIVCRNADANAIRAITKQIGWGRRVRGIVRESDLIEWYERCLRGKFADRLAKPLLRELLREFEMEFPQAKAIGGFLVERGYADATPHKLWQTKSDAIVSTGKK
ncbi:MAG: HaeII family restriction endonuclease [Chloroflexi bacterium]|nr:HaeII family restriction endonuclease [Chloroflexota bacterium]